MENTDLFVSVVAVLHDAAVIAPAFAGESYRLLDQRYTNFEIVLVDNGSGDATAQVVPELLGQYKCLRYLRLSRSMDDETAVIAGLDAAIGDYVVTLDPDFDPPAEIPAMVERCRDGHDVILGVDAGSGGHGPVYRAGRWAYFALTRWLVGVDLIQGTTGFRVLSRHAVNALTRVRQRRRYFAMLAAEIGFVTGAHHYRRTSRSGARPEVGLRRALRIGLSVIVNSSTAPLRLVSTLGLVGSLLSFLYSFYVIAIYLVKRDVMPGWTTMSLQVSGLFFLVFVMLALTG
jgi:glycosyltransferase involved in cell wall biosynthesis